jgi:membrane-bound ClpP family serine protease
MRFKRVLRHPNSSVVFLFLVVIGLLFCFFIASSVCFQMLGLMVSILGLILLTIVMHDSERMFWYSQYNWWDEGDGQFEAWQKGEL